MQQQPAQIAVMPAGGHPVTMAEAPVANQINHEGCCTPFSCLVITCLIFDCLAAFGLLRALGAFATGNAVSGVGELLVGLSSLVAAIVGCCFVTLLCQAGRPRAGIAKMIHFIYLGAMFFYVIGVIMT